MKSTVVVFGVAAAVLALAAFWTMRDEGSADRLDRCVSTQFTGRLEAIPSETKSAVCSCIVETIEKNYDDREEDLTFRAMLDKLSKQEMTAEISEWSAADRKEFFIKNKTYAPRIYHQCFLSNMKPAS